jgi:hypothetical protein
MQRSQRALRGPRNPTRAAEPLAARSSWMRR